MRALAILLALWLTIGSTSAQTPTLPEWLPPPAGAWPPDPAEVELGRRLFHDTRLSAAGEMSCATCHQQALAFTDGRTTAVGATGEAHPRNTPSIANVAYRPRLTRAHPTLRRLEDQLELPLFGDAPVEMGMAGREDALLALFRDDETYARLFAAAVEGPPSLAAMARAIAAFERTLISADAPFDRFRFAGETDAISPAAKRGAELFFSGRLGCGQCHLGVHLTDTHRDARLGFDEVAFHNIGLYNVGGTGAYPPGNGGLAEHTGRPADGGRFRTPSLRNVAVTAPYMHDGSVATLAEVIDIYAAGGRTITGGPLAGDGRRNPRKSALITGFEVTETEKADLIAFLESLTDESFLTNPAFADPFAEP